MSLGRTDSKERKDKILGITVSRYIETVSPVSSSWIAKNFRLGLSPATIRNILAELEVEGFLTHPHTSAGRIPTQLGYRYYVDNLMREIELLKEEKDRIKAEYEKETLALEALLDKTSRVISEITNYTSIISVDGWENKVFLTGTNYVVGYPDKNDLTKIKNILTALDEKERLLKIITRSLAKKIDIYIGHEIAYSEINNCSLVISEYKLRWGPSGRIAVLGPTRMDYQKVVSALEYFSELFEAIS